MLPWVRKTKTKLNTAAAVSCDRYAHPQQESTAATRAWLELRLILLAVR